MPPGLRDLLNLPGLGPKCAQTLYQQLQITSLDKLRTAAEKHRIRTLKGFGSKTEESILQALAGFAEGARRVYLAEAKTYADAIVRHLQATPRLGQIAVAGSFRAAARP